MQRASQAAAPGLVTGSASTESLSTGIGQWKDNGFRSQLFPPPSFFSGKESMNLPRNTSKWGRRKACFSLHCW